MKRKKITLRTKKNAKGRWPFARDEKGEKLIFPSFNKAREHATVIGAVMWRATVVRD